MDIVGGSDEAFERLVLGPGTLTIQDPQRDGMQNAQQELREMQARFAARRADAKQNIVRPLIMLADCDTPGVSPAYKAFATALSSWWAFLPRRRRARSLRT